MLLRQYASEDLLCRHMRALSSWASWRNHGMIFGHSGLLPAHPMFVLVHGSRGVYLGALSRDLVKNHHGVRGEIWGEVSFTVSACC